METIPAISQTDGNKNEIEKNENNLYGGKVALPIVTVYPKGRRLRDRSRVVKIIVC